jgi:hypothetical protein
MRLLALTVRWAWIHVGYNERCGKKLCPLRAVKGLIATAITPTKSWWSINDSGADPPSSEPRYSPHQSRPSTPTNVSRNVWHDTAQEHELHRCLPAHILLVRLCHHRRDWSGPSEVMEHNKTPQKDCGNNSISSYECLGALKLLYWGQFNHFLAIYFGWYNNQPWLAESQSKCGLLATKERYKLTHVSTPTIDIDWMHYWMGLHNNTSHYWHIHWLGIWSSADERVYEATVAVPTPAATAIALCFVSLIVMNALNRDSIGLIISNNGIETQLFSIK